LNYVLEKIVAKNELKYVNWLNYGAQAITPRHHALDMIPGVGKTFMTQIITQREDKPFESFEDLEKRVGLRDPGKLIAKKITSEIAENPRMTLFLNK
jgi:putative nucleotide binding protein|tara:strand:+ start:728 stop:1018 length:291 start_codon:yes stop_codon:yes gene_type:complete